MMSKAQAVRAELQRSNHGLANEKYNLHVGRVIDAVGIGRCAQHHNCLHRSRTRAAFPVWSARYDTPIVWVCASHVLVPDAVITSLKL